MARIPDGELDRIKGEVSLVRLIEGQGIALICQGKDLACRCPGTRGMMVVTLFYEEGYEGQAEAFEVSAVLEEHDDPVVRWWALPDWSTRRDIKG